ncbi:protein of unknown function [Ralstonia solanacearum CFBP2957]|nr:protein of unknown function [Ralstonia solanacearum CFBP2957]
MLDVFLAPRRVRVMGTAAITFDDQGVRRPPVPASPTTSGRNRPGRRGRPEVDGSHPGTFCHSL